MTAGQDQYPERLFDPYTDRLLIQEAKQICPVGAAREFKTLTELNLVPTWALEFLDLDVIRRAAL